MDNDFATGYALGSDSASGDRNNSGFWGGDGWWAIIIFAMIFGWGNGGWGGFGGGNGGGYAATAATQADIQRGFDNSAVIGKLDGINNGLCDGFYAVNNGLLTATNSLSTAMMQGFNAQTIAQMQGDNSLQAQLAQCCCDNRAAVADLKYTMATDTCAVTNAVQTAARDIIDSNNAGTRAILDYLCQDKIATLQAENNDLRRAASQDRQNALLTASMTAQTNQIIGTLRAPTPVPAYQVPNPNAYYNGCGCNSGCGC